jgi:K+-sensing histidine kinase KdpD
MRMGDKLVAVSRITRILPRLGRVLIGQGAAAPREPSARGTPRRWAPLGAYVGALAQAVVTTVVAELLFSHVSHVERADIILLYILGVMVVAARCGRGPAIVSAVLSVAAFDLFYIPPYLTFAVSNSRYILTFTVMLIVGLVISALTEQIRVQAQEAQTSELRARSEELRSSLLSSVSHDLRTPLAAVTGAASTLLTQGDALPATTRRDLLQAIYEEATRLGRLVANLLDMTRLESGTLALRREWTPIEEPIGAVLGYLEAQLGARDLRVTIAGGLPLLLLDAVLVEQLLVNLIENAIKYGGGGPIEIRAELVGDEVVLEVADHGPGIPSGSEDRIFEKFYRAAQGGASGGVGLGLAICRAVATAHGARIAAGHRPGGGAVFRVAFPRGDAPPPLPDEAAATVPESAT